MSAGRDDDDVLDVQQLDELRELAEEIGDPAFLVRLIDQYLEDAASRMAELQEATDRRDAPALVAAAHALKGGSATMGAKGVAALCADLEVAGRRGELPGPDDLARVSAELQLAAAALQAQMPLPDDPGKLS